MNGGKSNIAHSIHDRLLKISHEKQEELDKLLKRFAYEGFLRRLNTSSYSRQMVLKGGLLLMQLTKEFVRSTKDLDLLVYGENSEAYVREMVSTICAVRFDQDALVFDISTMKVEKIIDEEEYNGFRVKLIAHIGSSNIPLQIDMGFGDPVIPSPVELEYPSLLNLPSVQVLSYPVQSVIAEKVEAMVSRGEENSRMKDFYDIYVLSRLFEINVELLKAAIIATFGSRGTAIPENPPIALRDQFASDAIKKEQWRNFIKKNELQHAPDDLGEVMGAIREFILPVFGQINYEKSGESRL